MTRRIVAAILLAVWTTLIVGGAAAYWAVRSVMLAELDASVEERAAMLEPAWADGEKNDTPTRFPEDRYLIVDERGQTVARMPSTPGPLRELDVIDRTFSTLGDGTRVRTLTLVSPVGGRGKPVRIVYSVSAEAFDRTLQRLAVILLVGGGAAGALAALVANVVARRALRPLHEATAVIRQINVNHLDRRLEPSPLPAELRPVAVTVNEMLAALEDAVKRRQHFIADASHELRTPVAALMTALEVALSRPRGEAELRDVLTRCLSNVQSLNRLVRHLLDRVRSDHQGDDEPPREVAVRDKLGELICDVGPLAEGNDIGVHLICDDSLRVVTQPYRLSSIASNLLSNAVSYSRRGGRIEVRATARGRDLVLTVSDDGAGIAAEDMPHVFQPFYRGSSARESKDGHMGLGLFLVETHLKALRGRHDLVSEPGRGTTFTVTLPDCVLESGTANSIKAVQSLAASS